MVHINITGVAHLQTRLRGSTRGSFACSVFYVLLLDTKPAVTAARPAGRAQLLRFTHDLRRVRHAAMNLAAEWVVLYRTVRCTTDPPADGGLAVRLTRSLEACLNGLRLDALVSNLASRYAHVCACVFCTSCWSRPDPVLLRSAARFICPSRRLISCHMECIGLAETMYFDLVAEHAVCWRVLCRFELHC